MALAFNPVFERHPELFATFERWPIMSTTWSRWEALLAFDLIRLYAARPGPSWGVSEVPGKPQFAMHVSLHQAEEQTMWGTWSPDGRRFVARLL